MRLKTVTSPKGSVSYSVIEDYVNPTTHKKTSRVVRSFGNQNEWFEKLGTSDPEAVKAELKKLIRGLEEEKKNETVLLIPVDPHSQAPARVCNCGYLFPQKILSMLGLADICRQIDSRHKHQFDLHSIFNDLVLARMIFPSSKRASCKEIEDKFFDAPSYGLEDVYRALPILAKERMFIESFLYERSTKISSRDTSVLFYDCTNFYFETEDSDPEELRQYGKSKENRPNPIVQYGLFTDAQGMPLADYVFPGNRNEQPTLRKLEEKVEKEFGLSRFIVCADGGLNGFENKIYNARKANGAYIVTQSLKKLKASARKQFLDPEGWKLSGSSRTFNIDELADAYMINGKEVPAEELVFYKEILVETTRHSSVTGKKETLKERAICTYSERYKRYHQHIREKKLDRAKKLISRGLCRKSKNERDPMFFAKETVTTKSGEVATESKWELDYEKIAESAKYDGFYCVTTDLMQDEAEFIINANHRRFEIERTFRIMKYNLKSRPLYVSRDEAIEGHLLICFTALVVYKILEQYLKGIATCDEIFKTLREMNLTNISEDYFVRSFEPTDITNELERIFGYELNLKASNYAKLKKIIKKSKSPDSTRIMANLKRA